MKHQRHQEKHAKKDETSSNNENKKKNTTMKEVRGKSLLSLKTSARECKERHASETASL